MDKLCERDFGGANYRSRDPIKNLKIKVQLQRLSTATIGFVSKAGSPEEESVLTTNQFGQTILEDEELVVQWKQKYFSQREIEFYGFEPNCTTVLDYKYHSDVEKIKKSGGRRNNRLFSYLDKDRFFGIEDAFVPVTTSPEEIEPTDLARQVMEVRRRKAAESAATPLSNRPQRGRTVTGMKLVEEKPTDEFRLNHHASTTNIHTTVIMADLNPEGQLGRAEFERRICTIEYNENGVIRVTPDFTRSRPPYRIEDGCLGRDVWEFKVEHVSTAVSKMEARREAKIISELYKKHQNYLHSLVGEDFEELPPNLFRLNVYGEVISAQSFEYDDLHVQYLIDIPANWSCDPNRSLHPLCHRCKGEIQQRDAFLLWQQSIKLYAALLSGCTQTCRTTLVDNVEKAYYSQPFNFQAYFSLDDQTEDNQIEWPKLFVHVVSCDFWGRRRTEGYGFLTVPTQPGCHEVTVQCWRPTGNRGYDYVAAQRRRYFIGGTPELEDVTFTAIPNTFEGSKLAKYGVQTESTGSVTIKLNSVQQCKAFRDSSASILSKKKLQNALKLAKGKATQDAFYGTIDAFQKARKRMQLARETVPSQIRESAQKAAANRLFGMTDEEKIKNVLGKSEKQD